MASHYVPFTVNGFQVMYALQAERLKLTPVGAGRIGGRPWLKMVRMG